MELMGLGLSWAGGKFSAHGIIFNFPPTPDHSMIFRAKLWAGFGADFRDKGKNSGKKYKLINQQEGRFVLQKRLFFPLLHHLGYCGYKVNFTNLTISKRLCRKKREFSGNFCVKQIFPSFPWGDCDSQLSLAGAVLFSWTKNGIIPCSLRGC